MLVIYTRADCPFCDRAKNLLELKNIPYQQVRVDLVPEARQFLVEQGHRTVPQIYHNGQLFVENGYNGLSQLSEGVFNQLKKELNAS